MQANESYVLHVDRNAGTYVLTRNLRLIGPDPSNFRACENYTDLTRRTNFSLSLSLSSFIHPLRFLIPLSRTLFLSRSLSSSHTVEVTQNRAPGTGCLVPRCRYHEERMSIARSHSFREGETASADFTAFSYGAEKRATTLLLDRRSDPFDSYKSRDLQLDPQDRSRVEMGVRMIVG